MQKSVYSLVLMDDVVAAVDRLAYREGTSRSNMINRILAEYTQLSTPEQRMQDIFSAISAVLDSQSALQPMLSASECWMHSTTGVVTSVIMISVKEKLPEYITPR